MALMHGGDSGDVLQSTFSEPLHVAIAGHDVPNYDIIELLIDAGVSLECKVCSLSYTVEIYAELGRYLTLS